MCEVALSPLVAYGLRRRHWFGRSFRVISCPALGGFSCLGGEASREAEAGGSRAAQTGLQSARRAACFKSRQRLPPRPVFVVKKTRPSAAAWSPTSPLIHRRIFLFTLLRFSNLFAIMVSKLGRGVVPWHKTTMTKANKIRRSSVIGSLCIAWRVSSHTIENRRAAGRRAV